MQKTIIYLFINILMLFQVFLNTNYFVRNMYALLSKKKNVWEHFLISNQTQFILKKNCFKFDMNSFMARQFGNRQLIINKCDTVIR